MTLSWRSYFVLPINKRSLNAVQVSNSVMIRRERELRTQQFWLSATGPVVLAMTLVCWLVWGWRSDQTSNVVGRQPTVIQQRKAPDEFLVVATGGGDLKEEAMQISLLESKKRELEKEVQRLNKLNSKSRKRLIREVASRQGFEHTLNIEL